MATELQRRKFEKAFDRFDVDDDGVIGETDIAAMVQIWCQTFDIMPRSPGWTEINGLANKLWRDLQGSVDSDGNKSVGKEEWNAAMDNPDFVEKVALPFAVAVFDIADSDNDGKISLDEMIAAQSKAGISESETRRVFDKLDTDDDGYVERDEYAAAIREFYMSDDPNAPGNLMAGSI
jgi:Ca2+-binding EF-hand superfamily protein